MVADEPTLGELGRQIGGLSSRFDRFDDKLSGLVPRDVYDAHRVADRADVARVEAKADKLEAEADAREADRERERGEWRRAKWVGWLGLAGAILAAVVGPLITAAVLK